MLSLDDEDEPPLDEAFLIVVEAEPVTAFASISPSDIHDDPLLN